MAHRDSGLTIDDVRAAALRLRRRDRRHAVPAFAHAVGDLRLRGLPQVREPAVHGVVQGARRAQQDGAADAGRARQGRARGLGRQPCAGGRVPRRADGDRGDDRHAALRLVGEGREHARLRRRGRARGRHLRGRARRRPEARRGARLHGGPSVRRPRRDRRPGNGRARDAGAAAGDRHPRRRDRRRRPDRRHGDGGEGAAARHAHRRRPDRALPRGLERDPRRPPAKAARRRSPTASASSRPER